MKKIRVLETGAGSRVGQGIMKSLRFSGLPVTLIAVEIIRDVVLSMRR